MVLRSIYKKKEHCFWPFYQGHVFFPEVFDVRVARHRVHLQPVRDELDRDRQLGRIFFKLFHRNKKLPIF